MQRRTLISSLALASLAAAQTPPREEKKMAPVRLGIDLFSIRSQGWSAFQMLDYAAKQQAKVVHFSELRFLGSLDDGSLDKVSAYAANLGIECEVGMRSVCKTSKAFNPNDGPLEEQFNNGLRIAKRLKSPILRCFLGTLEDRKGPRSIEYHIDVTSTFLRSMKSRVQDLGLKIAIENHAGDMQARELKLLIEESGKDFVGACIDSGNPCWVLEDPKLTLETLAPYVLTSHVRDSSVWRTPEGIQVQWVRSGEGNVGLDQFIRRYAELCPGRALSAEVICIPSRNYAIYDPNFWGPYKTVPAWEFSRFLQIADSGKPLPAFPKLSKEEAVARELEDLTVSLAWMREQLGKLS